MLLMVKYLFSRSKAALAPPRRQDTTAAATLPSILSPPAKKSLSRKAQSWPVGPAKYTGEPTTMPWYSSSFSSTRSTSSSKTQRPVFMQLRQAMQPAMGLVPRYRDSVSTPFFSRVSATSFNAV